MSELENLQKELKYHEDNKQKILSGKTSEIVWQKNEIDGIDEIQSLDAIQNCIALYKRRIQELTH